MSNHFTNHLEVNRADLINMQIHKAIAAGDPSSEFWQNKYDIAADRFDERLTDAQAVEWSKILEKVNLRSFTFMQLAGMYEGALNLFIEGEELQCIAEKMGFIQPDPDFESQAEPENEEINGPSNS